MARTQFWGTAAMVGVGLGSILLNGQWVIGLALIGAGVWYGPFQREFWQ